MGNISKFKAQSYARSKTKTPRSEVGRFRSGKIVFVPETKAILCEIENRLGFSCGVSGMLAVGTIRNLNIRVLTQLRLELFRIQLLLYNCTSWMSTQSICPCCSTGVTTILCVACGSCSTLYILYLYRYLYFIVHVRSTSQRGSMIPGTVASCIYSSSANCSQPRCTPAVLLYS